MISIESGVKSRNRGKFVNLERNKTILMLQVLMNMDE